MCRAADDERWIAAELGEGEAARLNVKLENVSDKGQGMAVAIVGLPGGLTLPEDFAQLKDLARLREDGTKPGRIGAFEIRGRELVLYWRDLAPDADDRREPGPAGPGAGRLPRPGEPGVPVLQSGREMLDSPAGGDDPGEGVRF